MKHYAWSCFVCEASSPSDSASCNRCNCPVQATGAQVDAARQAWRQRSGLPPVESFDVVVAVPAFPPLIAAGMLGALALIVSTNASFSAFGALLALAAPCVSSYRPC
jgi:hypothetical protein